MLQIDFMANLLSVVLSKSVIALVHHPILLFRKHHINLDGHVHALMFMFSSSLQYHIPTANDIKLSEKIDLCAFMAFLPISYLGNKNPTTVLSSTANVKSKLRKKRGRQ